MILDRDHIIILLSFSLTHPFTLDIAPTKNFEFKGTKGTVSSTPSLQLVFQNLCEIQASEKSSCACQVSILRSEVIHKASLNFQPPTEIFNSFQKLLQQPIIFEPTKRYSAPGHRRPTQFLTSDGNLIDVPPLSEITPASHPVAVNVARKMIVDELKEQTSNLMQVINEIANIDKEPDPKKKETMKSNIGTVLEVEKDNIISQIRERITELEQIMSRTDPDQSLLLTSSNSILKFITCPSIFVPPCTLR